MKRGIYNGKSSRNRGYHGEIIEINDVFFSPSATMASQVLLSVARNLGTLATHAQRCGQQLAVPWWNDGRFPSGIGWKYLDLSGFRWNFSLDWNGFISIEIDLDMGFELPKKYSRWMVLKMIPLRQLHRARPADRIHGYHRKRTNDPSGVSWAQGSCQVQGHVFFLCLDQLGGKILDHVHHCVIDSPVDFELPIGCLW